MDRLVGRFDPIRCTLGGLSCVVWRCGLFVGLNCIGLSEWHSPACTPPPRAAYTLLTTCTLCLTPHHHPPPTIQAREQPHRGGGGNVHPPQGPAREALRRRPRRLEQPPGGWMQHVAHSHKTDGFRVLVGGRRMGSYSSLYIDCVLWSVPCRWAGSSLYIVSCGACHADGRAGWQAAQAAQHVCVCTPRHATPHTRVHPPTHPSIHTPTHPRP